MSLAAIANFRLFGEKGLRVILGHIVEMAQLLREHLEGHEGTTVLNRDNFGTVTLFRTYPIGVDTFLIKRQEFEDAGYRESLLSHNDYNRRIFQGRAVGGDGGPAVYSSPPLTAIGEPNTANRLLR